MNKKHGILLILVVLVSASIIVLASMVAPMFASNDAVVAYYVPELTEFNTPVAVFMRGGVLYAVYDNYESGTTVVRLDTGEVVKTCAFSDYNYIGYIVGGIGTAYAAMSYWNSSTDQYGLRIFDVLSCDVIAEIPNADLRTMSGICSEGLNCFLRYDMYNDKLLVAYIYNGEVDRLALVDPISRKIVKTVDLGLYSNGMNVLEWVCGVYVGPNYYYVSIYYLNSSSVMFVFDKNLTLYKTISPAPCGCATYTNLQFFQAAADIDINRYGALLHKIVNDSSTMYYFYWYRTLVLYDHLFTNGVVYSTDADKAPCAACGVVAYKDVFVVHSGMSDHVMQRFSWVPVPYIFVFYPDRGIAINTSVIGIAVPVDYNLWSNNKIVAFDPTTGYIYVIDATTLATATETATTPTTTVTETQTTAQTVTITTTSITTVTVTTTITETKTITTTETVASSATTTNTITTAVTTTATPYPPSNTTTITTTITTTETKTQTVTTTVTPYPPATSSWLLPLILLLIILAITGIIKMATKSIITQKTTFIKKK